MTPSPPSRTWSWVASTLELGERREHARRLCGLELEAVRYINLDYARFERPIHDGPRAITEAREWEKPTWQWQSFDSVDYGVELLTDCSRVFSVAWDPPGPLQQGIGLREVPLLGTAISEDTNVAVWDVTQQSRWAAFVGTPISDVELDYEPWKQPEGFWCRRITLRFGGARVEMILGDKGPGEELGPSADSVAVLFFPAIGAASP
jgi:hypothetical protein